MFDWKTELDWTKAAVIVVDMQNDFCHKEGSGSLNGGDVTRHYEIVPNIQRLIDAAHESDAPVFFIKTTHDNTRDSPAWLSRRRDRKHPTCVTGTWGVEYFGVAPEPGDIEIIKHRFSAFIGTDLELKLRAQGIETILLTGVGTNVCVESTMRDGFMLDFYSILVTDCTAAGSQAAYDGTLANMSRSFGWLSDSIELSGLLLGSRQVTEAAS